jgi:hypothetical protein
MRINSDILLPFVAAADCERTARKASARLKL